MPTDAEWRLIGIGGGTLAALALLSKPTGALSVPVPALPSAPSRRFGTALVTTAQADVGVTETGPNTGPRVDAMLATYGAHAANWCAAAVGTWIRETAAKLGVAPPIPGSAGAKNTMLQFQDPKNPKVGWIPVEILRSRPELVGPGMVPIWTRGVPGSWMGHIGVCTSGVADGTFGTVEGNAGASSDRVIATRRQLRADTLLGMGFFQDAAIFGTGVGYLPDPSGVATFSPTQEALVAVRGEEARPAEARPLTNLAAASRLRYVLLGVGTLAVVAYGLHRLETTR